MVVASHSKAARRRMTEPKSSMGRTAAPSPAQLRAPARRRRRRRRRATGKAVGGTERFYLQLASCLLTVKVLLTVDLRIRV